MAADDELALPSDPPLAEVVQSADQPVAQDPVRPSRVVVSVTDQPGPMRIAVNLWYLIAHVSDSKERTANLEQIVSAVVPLVWALVSLTSLIVALVSIFAIIDTSHQLAGKLGLFAAITAGLGPLIAMVRRWWTRRRGSKRGG